jgi:hypothetical protein
MQGFAGSDHFRALDGGKDFVFGGFDSDIDVVDNFDPFDNIFDIP